MQLFGLSAMVWGACVILMLIPAIFVVSFLVLGRRKRLNDFRSHRISSLRTSKLLITEAPPGMQFGDFMSQRYNEFQSWKRYLLPLVAFYVPYCFGLYWSFVILASESSVGVPIEEMTAILQQRPSAIAASGFIGSAVLVLTHLAWRVVTTDLTPRTFIHLSVRLVTVPVLGIAMVSAVDAVTGMEATAPLFIAFGAGLFPLHAMRLIRRCWLAILRNAATGTQDLPLRNIQGIDTHIELRLWEEGINDAQHLAWESLVTLLVQTNYTLERLMDWKDQAILYCYVQDHLPKYHSIHVRCAIDVTGLSPKVYDKDKYPSLRDALAEKLDEPAPVLDRFIDNLSNDPSVEQLWRIFQEYNAINDEPPKTKGRT